MTCIVCGAKGSPFCPTHAAAPSGKRGGWISAHRRKLALAEHVSQPLDASQIVKKLWIGAAPPVDRPLSGFTLIVLAAREVQPEHPPWAARIVRARLCDDVPTQTEILHAVTAARQAAEEVRRGGRVLSSCAAGRNRSALVAAMSLLMLTPRATPDLIIRRIRERRHPDCLSNKAFVEVLRSIWSSRSIERR